MGVHGPYKSRKGARSSRISSRRYAAHENGTEFCLIPLTKGPVMIPANSKLKDTTIVGHAGANKCMMPLQTETMAAMRGRGVPSVKRLMCDSADPRPGLTPCGVLLQSAHRQHLHNNQPVTVVKENYVCEVSTTIRNNCLLLKKVLSSSSPEACLFCTGEWRRDTLTSLPH